MGLESKHTGTAISIAAGAFETALGYAQTEVKNAYRLRGFSGQNPMLLLAGLMEEVGELAEVINALQHLEFGSCPGKEHLLEQPFVNIAAELGDVVTYALAIANYYNVIPTVKDTWKQRGHEQGQISAGQQLGVAIVAGLREGTQEADPDDFITQYLPQSAWCQGKDICMDCASLEECEDDLEAQALEDALSYESESGFDDEPDFEGIDGGHGV